MTADTIGGVWTYAIDLCRALAAHRVEIVLVTMGRMPDEAQILQASELKNVRLVPTEYRLEWMGECEPDLVRSGQLLLELEREFNPDIIHLNSYWHASLPLRAPILLVAHSCVRSWWAACRGTELPPEWSKYQSWVRKAVAAAATVVAPTAAYLGEFQQLHGAARRAWAVHNGRERSLFHSGAKQKIALAAGRVWDEAKNIALVCSAASGVTWPVYVAGDFDGPGGETAPRRNLTFVGRLTPTDLAKAMAEAAIFVAPAKYEPFGLTILEAALSGCALVLSDIPSLRELWDGAAVFVDPSNAEQLREILHDLISDPQMTAAWGAKACTRAAQYSDTAMAASYFEIYGELLASGLEAVA